MKLKEIFDQSDTIIEPWPDFEANCFHMGGLCRSAFKLHLTYGESVGPENAATQRASKVKHSPETTVFKSYAANMSE